MCEVSKRWTPSRQPSHVATVSLAIYDQDEPVLHYKCLKVRHDGVSKTIQR